MLNTSRNLVTPARAKFTSSVYDAGMAQTVSVQCTVWQYRRGSCTAEVEFEFTT